MRYEAPNSLDQAVALLAKETGEARVLAGGTDLLVQMRTDIIDPVLVVDIKGIAELRQIKEEGGGYRIGAAVTGAELKEHPKLKSVWPGVVEAANLIGSTQIQGRATMGGNLCNGSPAADSVPALIAAGAKASIVGPKGRRDIPVEDVMLAPRKLALTKGEIIASFLLPAKPARTGEAYLRFIPRTEMDIAVVGCGVCLTLDAKGKCTAARVSLGAVARAAAAGCTSCSCPGRQHGRRRRLAEARRRGAAPPAGRSTTSAAPRNIASRSRAFSPAGLRRLRWNGRGRADVKTSRILRRSTAMRSSSCARRRTLCSMSCATSWG